METERKDTVYRIISGSADAIYQAMVDPKALSTWLSQEDHAKGMNSTLENLDAYMKQFR